MRLKYDSKNTFYKDPFGAVAAGTAIAFRVEADAVRASLFVREDGWDGRGEEIRGVPDGDSDCRGGLLLFQFSWKAQRPGLYFYHFEASGEDGKPLLLSEEYPLTVYSANFQTPDWLSGGLMYQIFPDRFARSTAYTAPEQKKDYRMHEKWGEPPVQGPDEEGVVRNNDFFGGNLKGIQDRLPYLEELGVTVLYLNPIFRAYSNHRYDTANYMEIDPMLGTEQDFAELCAQAKKRGIRIILDGVFNHTGSHSLYFNKDGAFDSAGAYQSRESPFYSWYSFQEFPDKYDSWWGIDTLPSVNEMEESYRDYIIRGEDSVIRHWMRLGASGIRLDVADELPDLFIEEVRQAVKEEDGEGALIGEVWEDASDKVAYGVRRRYFQGAQLDSVMNYPLKDWLIDFLVNHQDGALFQAQIMSLMEHYPKMCARSLMNILGTHDTERILTVFLKSADTFEEGRQKLFLALLVWAFLPGIPCVYYGDELGMEGGRDPMNRCCFEPDKAKGDIRAFYRRLLFFRRDIPELGTMEYDPSSCGDGYFSFRRVGPSESVLIFLNVGEETQRLSCPLEGSVKAVDLINCGSVSFEGRDTLLLEPGSGAAILFRKI